MPHLTGHDYLQRRKAQLEKERSSFISHWRELSDFIQPRRGRFFISDRNKGEKVHNNIINSAGGQAHRVAVSGMLAGTMSPSRPWFDMETHDPDLMESQNVRLWLDRVVLTMRRIYNTSNFYGQASTLLSELLLFGTGSMIHVDDFDDVARFYTQTIGSYYLAQNDRMVVDTFMREFEWTVGMIVAKFGLENVSTFVKDAYDRGNYETWAKVCHIIEPNFGGSKDRPEFGTDKPFVSIYYEPEDKGPANRKLLSVSGFDSFPVYAPRWETTTEDIYGTNCPGMIALGDVKMLQVEEREKAKGLEKMISPPLSGPASLKNVPVNSLPGGLTIYNGLGQQQLSPIYQVQVPLQEMRIDMEAVTQRINSAFFVDLFLAISNIQGIQPRNELDILSRNEERLLQLGPVLERLHGEFLEPMINRTFEQGLKAGIFPPIPQELAGQELRIKFISNLAIAQRAVVTGDLDRILAAAVGVAQIDPESVLKIDGQQYLDEYARAIGVPVKVIRPDDQVAAIQDQRRQKQEAAEGLQAAEQAAGAAQKAAGAKTGEQNLLTDLMEQAGEQ